jgi:hypothetical protein
MAIDAALEAQQGWSSEGSDGGSPIAPVAPVRNTPSPAGKKEQARNIDSPWKNATTAISHTLQPNREQDKYPGTEQRRQKW